MRNTNRKTWESFNSSKSHTNIPPWCSSGKVFRRKLVPKCEIQSSYPLRENIWEYLRGGENFKSGKRRRKVCAQRRGTSKLVGIMFVLLIAGFAYLWRINSVPSALNLMDKLISRTKLSFDWKPSVNEECCHKMRYLALELSRAEHNLRCQSSVYRLYRVQEPKEIQKFMRSTLRLRRITRIYPVTESTDRRYIAGVIASKSSDTIEWGGRVALWGVIPLWKAAPPPDTVLSLRTPTPADCWPFSGSSGELIIQLPKTQIVSSLSVEHVRPDTAKSAPKLFTIYGMLANSTLVKVMDNQYCRNGPAKQYYPLGTNAAMNSIIFRVLSNHGNVKYTCIYRIHLYGKGKDVL